MKTRIVNIATTGTATGRPVAGRPAIFQGVKGENMYS